MYSTSSDPVIHNGNNERSTVKKLLEKLILEDEQFDVRSILPNTVPDPASLKLESDYACPMGQVVMAPDCGKFTIQPNKIIYVLINAITKKIIRIHKYHIFILKFIEIVKLML